MTKKLLDLVTLVGDFISVIAVIPLLLGLHPSWLILCPKSSISQAKKTHFEGLNSMQIVQIMPTVQIFSEECVQDTLKRVKGSF